jgi:hypothetical protein
MKLLLFNGHGMVPAGESPATGNTAKRSQTQGFSTQHERCLSTIYNALKN